MFLFPLSLDKFVPHNHEGCITSDMKDTVDMSCKGAMYFRKDTDSEPRWLEADFKGD
jgi:hypothetical protein